MTFIIEKQGTRIGRLMMDFGPRSAHIVDLTFIKEARGHGYGKAIIQAVQHIAHKQTLPVSLMVERQNRSARNLYLSLGFTQEQATPSHDLMTWLPPANRIYSGI
jgi:ribosomal protein S18 acetylase RimI-like enzyme